MKMKHEKFKGLLTLMQRENESLRKQIIELKCKLEKFTISCTNEETADLLKVLQKDQFTFEYNITAFIFVKIETMTIVLLNSLNHSQSCTEVRNYNKHLIYDTCADEKHL